jgi:hypothetical protein
MSAMDGQKRVAGSRRQLTRVVAGALALGTACARAGDLGTEERAGASDASGFSGTAGEGGVSGSSGIGGSAGAAGASSSAGTAGDGGSGPSGKGGTSGTSGKGGTSGTSGKGGTSGTSGKGGTSGTGGTGACTGSCIPRFGYTPTNFSPSGLQPESTDESTLLNCGVSTFDSTTLAFGNWCGRNEPTPVVRSQSGGPEVVVLPFRNLGVEAGSTLRLTGSRPVILAAFGNVVIGGSIDADANGTTPGAGGNWSCGASQGGNGSGSTALLGGASGGGGGLGTAGGKGGIADTDGTPSSGGLAGVARGNSTPTPLLGGCAGGQAGDCSTAGGAGGGAVQISSTGTLWILGGTLHANGANGATPCDSNGESGGTGGGSGGTILLEAPNVQVDASSLQVTGGRGGANGRSAGVFPCGGTSGGTPSTTASSPGTDGIDCQGGSPGGGGGFGRAKILVR